MPFRNVFVPNLGLTRAPYSSTTRPSAGQPNRPRIAPSPTPGALLSLGAATDFGAFTAGGGIFATRRLSWRSRTKASSRRVVVGSLVLDPSQDDSALARFSIGLGPLALRLAPEGRELLAPSLQPVLPVRQTFRS